MTRNDIKWIAQNRNAKIYICGYCELQTLEKYCYKIGFNSGCYGWNYNVYSLPDGNILVTGYRTEKTMGKFIDHDTCEKIEKIIKKELAKVSTSNYRTYANRLNQKFVSTYYNKVVSFLEDC